MIHESSVCSDFVRCSRGPRALPSPRPQLAPSSTPKGKGSGPLSFMLSPLFEYHPGAFLHGLQSVHRFSTQRSGRYVFIRSLTMDDVDGIPFRFHRPISNRSSVHPKKRLIISLFLRMHRKNSDPRNHIQYQIESRSLGNRRKLGGSLLLGCWV